MRILLVPALLAASVGAAAQTAAQVLELLPEQTEAVAYYPRPKALEAKWSAITGLFGKKQGLVELKAQTGIDQMKKIEVPYVLKDVHKSALQLALYSLNLKDQVSLNSTDPMKSLAAVSSLQAVVQKSTDIQSQLSKILSDYGIDAIKFP